MCDTLWFWYTHWVRLRFPYGRILERSWFLQRGPLLVINLSYNPCRWRYKWVIGVITPTSGVMTRLTTGSCAYLVGFLIFRWKTLCHQKQVRLVVYYPMILGVGFYITQLVQSKKTVHHQWFIYLYMQNLRIVAFFLLDVSKSFSPKGMNVQWFIRWDEDQPMLGGTESTS